MQTIIIYKSKTGFTEKYAKWIAEELGCSILPYENITPDIFLSYSLVIFGSRIHAGRVDCLSRFLNLADKNQFTNVIVFATGGTAGEATEEIEKIWKASFTKKDWALVPHFYMRGGLNYEKMGAADRLIMKGLANMLNMKKVKSKYEAGCENAIQSSYDASSKEFIHPLINYIHEKRY